MVAAVDSSTKEGSYNELISLSSQQVNSIVANSGRVREFVTKI